MQRKMEFIGELAKPSPNAMIDLNEWNENCLDAVPIVVSQKRTFVFPTKWKMSKNEYDAQMTQMVTHENGLQWNEHNERQSHMHTQVSSP